MYLHLLFLAFTLYCTARALWKTWKYDLHKIPSPPGFPFVGHALAMTRAPLYSVFRKWNDVLGNPKVMRVRAGIGDILFVMDAEIAKRDVFAKGLDLPKPIRTNTSWLPYMSGNREHPPSFTIVTSTPYVKLVRRMLARCMSTQALHHSLPKLTKIAHQMMEAAEQEQSNEGAVNLQELFSRTAFDTIGDVGFDLDFGGLSRAKTNYELIGTCMRELRKMPSSPLAERLAKMLPQSKKLKTMEQNREKLIAVWHEIAVDIRQRQSRADPSTTIWAALKELRDPETNAPVSVEVLRGEVGTLVIGGIFSTGRMLGWTCALLATYPHVIDKITDELKAHALYGPNAQSLDFENLAKLEYLTAVFKESLRLVQVRGGSAGRCTEKDMKLGGYRIPKGITIFVGGTNMRNSDPEWSDTLEFKPERWLSGDDMYNKFYFPFGGGERDCIGQRFAMNTMKFFLAKFISTYSFRLTENETFQSLFADQTFYAAVEAKKGIRMRIERRM